MYTAYFGFQEQPFNLTPDPRYLFLSTHHKEALDLLLYGIESRKGFMAVTGGIGTGKTTLCRALLGHLDNRTKTALIFRTFLSDTELLKTVNQEFGITMETSAETKEDYINALNQFLLQTYSEGGNAVLLVDEAQNLSPTVLEHIRMLSNLETESQKLLQIILIGQPELKELLSTPSLKQLDERITLRYHLRALSQSDVRGYVEHRLVVAGDEGTLSFTGGAYKAVYAYSRGNPRRINAVCDRALLVAYAKDKSRITRNIVQKAVRDLQGAIKLDPLLTSGVPGRRIGLAAATALVLALFLAFTMWSYREDLFGLLTNEHKHAIATIGKSLPGPPKTKRKIASLLLDETTSLAGLFSLFGRDQQWLGRDGDGMDLAVVSFDLEPEYYVMLNRPFRIRVSSPSPQARRYLLVKKVTDRGAVALDADGNSRHVGRDFILDHWGDTVSWIHPYRHAETYLRKGMDSPDVLNIQKILNAVGYLVEPSGTYDRTTVEAVTKFQTDFGLSADGIVGPKTMALLYQVAD